MLLYKECPSTSNLNYQPVQPYRLLVWATLKHNGLYSSLWWFLRPCHQLLMYAPNLHVRQNAKLKFLLPGYSVTTKDSGTTADQRLNNVLGQLKSSPPGGDSTQSSQHAKKKDANLAGCKATVDRLTSDLHAFIVKHWKPTDASAHYMYNNACSTSGRGEKDGRLVPTAATT